jgi:hypothetical protein
MKNPETKFFISVEAIILLAAAIAVIVYILILGGKV